MSDVDRRFHETWLGMVQPIDGLVVSIPVLVDAQCAERQPPHVQGQLVDLCPPTRQGESGPEGYAIANVATFLSTLLGYAADAFDAGDALPEALSLYVPEGRQTLRATLGLKKAVAPAQAETSDATPASLAGAAYAMLVWEIPASLDLDKPETVTGSWDYPPAAKFDRLLRHVRVPIGLLTNRDAVRLVYAPHGESSGAITFRVDDMASVGGRPILDAFVMLLAANRFFGVAEERTLPALLAESRKRQANVTNDLADQVFDALQILLRGFEAAAERDGRDLLDDALAREGDHLYRGLLTVLLRLVFVLYAEDRGLLPVEHPIYAEHLSVVSLFEQLLTDRGAYPDSMSRRFGAWGRLVALFRAVFLGVSHGDLRMPPRRGSLFNPHEYPFLEGWGPAGSAPITQAEDRAAVNVPSVDDETVFHVLEKLLVFEGQRLSYRALDVEQIGSIYEALMGFHVQRIRSAAACLKPQHLWVTADEVTEVESTGRAKWLRETVGLNAAQSTKLATELESVTDTEGVLEVLRPYAAAGKQADPSLCRARSGQLVLQPGSERRRTSSHYTPRSLSEPIVRRTLEPLLVVLGDAPASERILSLNVCDPAMGSGAFLVEACRFLGDRVLAAWTREDKVEAIAAAHGDLLLHARRLVAQRCLYGVDKNEAAVELAKLSLWLVTLSKTLPFTFLDHCLRHGDSLVGLDLEQIRTFHWTPPAKDPSNQLQLFGREIAVALDEAILIRQKIGSLGDLPIDDREKARLLWDAQDALDRVRLIADVIVGAFFAHDRITPREAERVKREEIVRTWLAVGGPPTEELLAMQREIRERLPVFHWMVEFPEVFHAGRRDPLEEKPDHRPAHMDAFVGNPPFLGGKRTSTELGNRYADWLSAIWRTSKNADLVSRFFLRANDLLGAHGTMGFIATHAIGQGETRRDGLQRLVAAGLQIYDATRSVPWPGEANVQVATVHLAKGNARSGCTPLRLDGQAVEAVDSHLREGTERHDARPLGSNGHLAFVGNFLRGEGFVLSSERALEILEAAPHERRVVLPFLGGEEVNTDPGQSFHRYVVDFTGMSAEQAERDYPMSFRHILEHVKPYRESLQDYGQDKTHKWRWWQFANSREDMRKALTPLERCMVAARVTTHLAVSFQPAGRVFSDQLAVFAFSRLTDLAILQSRVHEVWARSLSSSLGVALRYSVSDCFETFPFPKPDPRTIIQALEDIGERLYDLRAEYMVDENVGLTIAYNRLKDPACTDARILELRALHEEMDRQVLEAYAEGDPEGRWLDVEVSPFCPMNDDDKAKLAAFEQAVIGRLFVLNAKRAEEEKLRGLGTTDGKKKGPAKKGASREDGEKKPRRAKKAEKDQLKLGADEEP
ncbi:MAG: DNA methyltransferase [Polyangiaceae bacterium]|jgi:hypothetical protein